MHVQIKVEKNLRFNYTVRLYVYDISKNDIILLKDFKVYYKILPSSLFMDDHNLKPTNQLYWEYNLRKYDTVDEWKIKTKNVNPFLFESITILHN